METTLAEILKELIIVFRDNQLDQECPHCNRPLSLPTDEDIENYIKLQSDITTAMTRSSLESVNKLIRAENASRKQGSTE